MVDHVVQSVGVGYRAAGGSFEVFLVISVRVSARQAAKFVNVQSTVSN